MRTNRKRAAKVARCWMMARPAIAIAEMLAACSIAESLPTIPMCAVLFLAVGVFIWLVSPYLENL